MSPSFTDIIGTLSLHKFYLGVEGNLLNLFSKDFVIPMKVSCINLESTAQVLMTGLFFLAW